jgi:protoporphyrinogen oxidase
MNDAAAFSDTRDVIDDRSIAVIGGGMLGLTLAHRLKQQGRLVTLYEAAPTLGGLAGAWSLPIDGEEPVVWDRHYHVTLLSDSHTRGILAELGLEDEMEWVKTRTGYYSDGHLSSVSNTLEFLRLPALNLFDKLRLGATIWYGSRVTDWRKLEQIDVETWLRQLSGGRAFRRFWLPQLRAKLGDAYTETSAAFLWATIQRLYAARRSGLKEEMFGYVPGGYARILERFGELLHSEGVRIELGSRIARVESVDGRVVVTGSDGETDEYDDVIVTAAAPLAARLCPGLAPAESARLARARYQGIVCASLVLRRPLEGYYLTYIADDVPFTTVIEMSSFVDRRHFGGHTLVYLPKYLPPDDPFFEADDDEVRARFMPALLRLYPYLVEDDVLAFRVSRVRQVFAISTLGYSERVPPLHTSQPGIHLCGSAQIVNGTLNVDEAVALAERAARRFSVGSDRPRPRSQAVQPA